MKGMKSKSSESLEVTMRTVALRQENFGLPWHVGSEILFSVDCGVSVTIALFMGYYRFSSKLFAKIMEYDLHNSGLNCATTQDT